MKVHSSLQVPFFFLTKWLDPLKKKSSDDRNQSIVVTSALVIEHPQQFVFSYTWTGHKVSGADPEGVYRAPPLSSHTCQTPPQVTCHQKLTFDPFQQTENMSRWQKLFTEWLKDIYSSDYIRIFQKLNKINLYNNAQHNENGKASSSMYSHTPFIPFTLYCFHFVLVNIMCLYPHPNSVVLCYASLLHTQPWQ